MSPDNELGWRVATGRALAEFEQRAEAIGFLFQPDPDTAPLQGILTPRRFDPALDPLPLLLSLPIFFCYEAGLRGPATTADTSLALLITARTAFSCDPGTAFARALSERCKVAAERLPDLRLCLHEAIANAVIHGNFELEGGEFLAPAEFLERAARLDKRLSDPVFADRTVRLTAHWTDSRLSITIIDQGLGFPLPPHIDSRHGLGLIAEKCDQFQHAQGGRELTMHFNQGRDLP